MSSAFTMGFLRWLDDLTPCRCSAMVATAWAGWPKPLLPYPMFYDAHATPTDTLLFIHSTDTTKDLAYIWRNQIDLPGIFSSPFCSALIHLLSFHSKRSSANY